jgi:hypothetical protein
VTHFIRRRRGDRAAGGGASEKFPENFLKNLLKSS